MRQDADVLLNFLFSHMYGLPLQYRSACREKRESQTNDAPKQVTNIGFVQPEIQGFGHNFAPPRLFRHPRRRSGTIIIKD
jgi:hypothetical protein